MSYCRSCGAPIKWIRTKNGKPHPVDPAKHYIIKGEGSATLVTEAGTFIRGEFVSVEEGANGEGYTSHFATCPNASRWRRRENGN